MAMKRTIKEAITRKFPVIDTEDNLLAAAGLMKKENVSVLAVKVREELIGLLTVKDILYSLSNDEELAATRVADAMTPCEFNTTEETRNPCIQLDEDEDVQSAVKLMYDAGVNHLLVTGAGGQTVGIVSGLQIIKLLAP
ncbi:MAG TPA: CBS domain-containing protein [Desulfopila sp.]|nr:CBS domain-containing protein [Desulfopila sp.]